MPFGETSVIWDCPCHHWDYPHRLQHWNLTGQSLCMLKTWGWRLRWSLLSLVPQRVGAKSNTSVLSPRWLAWMRRQLWYWPRQATGFRKLSCFGGRRRQSTPRQCFTLRTGHTANIPLLPDPPPLQWVWQKPPSRWVQRGKPRCLHFRESGTNCFPLRAFTAKLYYSVKIKMFCGNMSVLTPFSIERSWNESFQLPRFDKAKMCQ